MLQRLLGVLLVIALPLVSGAARGTLEGRWLLVRETFGDATSNRVEAERPLRLELSFENGRLAGRVVLGANGGESHAWPMSGEAGATIRVEELLLSPGRDQVRVRYRTEAAPGTDAVEFVEEYRVSGDGRTLTGTVSVSKIHDGERAGSYELHRVFEKER